MKIWTEYKKHEPKICGKKKKFDNTIYSFDIETSSYLILNNKIINASDYLQLDKKQREDCIYQSSMYIWQFSINDEVFYGRTWNEFILFIKRLENNVPEQKTIFVHNLAFEFQYLKNIFHFEDVIARKSHKVMTASLRDYNIVFTCTYYMSNVALKELPRMFNLPVKKMVGDLDYNKIRHSNTILTDEELGYCENDCLVIYYYILEELKTYEFVTKIPKTSTGHVRRELKELVMQDYKYKNKVRRSINTDTHVYNLLVDSFQGGYTHANWLYTDEVLKDIDSYDISSSYPYVLVAFKFPSSKFQKINLKNIKFLDKRFAYILRVKFTNLKSKYYNNFISASKCSYIKKGKYDNGRLISADEIEMTLTDIDFYLIRDTYDCEIEVLECYYANKDYLPLEFINFVLKKYVNKTILKGVEGKELEYQKEKNKFNALFGMSVTNTIRDNVIYDDKSKLWSEEELTNDEIIEKLLNEEKQGFLSFAYGVWVTAYAKDNLIRRVIELDEHVVYCDTDSCKLTKGYDKSVFTKYNDSVLDRLKYLSDLFNIPLEKFMPKDKKGRERPLGIFEKEEKERAYTYDEFITQGAKKYAYKMDNEIHITVAGVPKIGACGLKSLDDFRDNFVFKFEHTHKNLLVYCDNQIPINLIDYQGRELVVKDISGCCVIPTTYILKKSNEYVNLLSDESSARAKFKEG